MEFNLNESLDAPAYDYKLEKEDMNHATYSFTDEKGHDYKFLLYRKGTAGKFVWTAIVSEKTPSARAYRRVVGRFNNPKRVLSTILEIFRFIHKERKSRVKGLIFELPTKVFGGEVTPKLERILRLSLRGLYDVPKVSYSDEETERLKVVGIPLVLRPFKYKDVFTVGDHKETEDLGDVEHKDLKRGSDKKQQVADKKEPIKVEDKKSEDKVKERKPATRRIKKELVKDVDSKVDDTSKDEPVKKEVKKTKIDEPFSARLGRHINKYSATNLKAKDPDEKAKKEMDPDLVFKSIKDLDGADYKDEKYNNRVFVNFKNESTNVQFMYTVDGMVKFELSKDGYDDTTDYLKDKEVKDLISTFKAGKYADTTVRYVSKMSAEEFIKLASKESTIKQLSAFVEYKRSKENDLTDEDTKELKKFFGYRIGSLSSIIDKESGLIKFESKTFKGSPLKVTSSISDSILSIEFDKPADEIVNTAARYSNKLLFEESGNKTILKVERYVGDMQSVVDFLNEVSSDRHLVDDMSDDFGNKYYMNKGHNDRIVMYMLVNEKFKNKLPPSDEGSGISLSYNGENIYATINNAVEYTLNYIDRMFKMINYVDTSRSNQVDHGDVTDKDLENKINLDEVEKHDYKADINEVKAEFVAVVYNMVVKFKNFKFVPDKQLYDLYMDLGTIKGKSVKESLLDSVTKLTKDNEYSTSSFIAAANKNSLITNASNDYLKTIDKAGNLGYFSDDYLDASTDKDDLIKEIKSKYLPGKKPTVDLINKAYDDINKDFTDYLGYKLKADTYYTKPSSAGLRNVSIDYEPASKADLIDTIKKLVKFSTSTSKGFSKREDGTRHSVLSSAGSLITDYIKNNVTDIKTADILDLMSVIKQLPSKDQPTFMTTDPERFRNTFWMTWASRGGTLSHDLCYAMCNDILENDIDKPFWGEGNILKSNNESIEVMNPYLKAHFKWMYNETQEFYKKKLGKKYNGYKVKLYRGVASDEGIDRYTPATIESWTTLKGTAQSFAKSMSQGRHQFVLVAEIPITAIIGSWEHLAVDGDFPREVDIKGKKEFMVLGGALKDIDVTSYYATDKDADTKKVKVFENFATFLTESDDENSEASMTKQATLKVLFPGDKGFTSPDSDPKMATGVVTSKLKS